MGNTCMLTARPVSYGPCSALLRSHTPVLNCTTIAGQFCPGDLVIWDPLAFWHFIL